MDRNAYNPSTPQKEGSGRVAIYKATGFAHCYTLESNYNTGKYTNTIPPATGPGSARAPAAQLSKASAPAYTPEIWYGVGRACLFAILDLHEDNPWSRLPKSSLKSIAGARKAICTKLGREKTYRAQAMILKSSKGTKANREGRKDREMNTTQKNVQRTKKKHWEIATSKVSVESSDVKGQPLPTHATKSSSALKAASSSARSHVNVSRARRRMCEGRTEDLSRCEIARDGTRGRVVENNRLYNQDPRIKLDKDHTSKIPRPKLRMTSSHVGAMSKREKIISDATENSALKPRKSYTAIKW